MPALLHYMWRVDGNRTALHDRAERLAALRAVLGTQVRILLFCFVDNHVHLVVEVRTSVRWTRSALSHALSSSCGAHGDSSASKLVDSRAYLTTLVRYHFAQSDHHALPVPAAVYDGSCFQDLVGARLINGFDPSAIRSHLPRLRDAELFGFVGLPLLTPTSIDGASLAALMTASQAVFGASGVGREAHEASARALAVRAARQAGFQTKILRDELGLSDRGLRKLAAVPISDTAGRALRLQLALRRPAAVPAQTASGRHTARAK